MCINDSSGSAGAVHRVSYKHLKFFPFRFNAKKNSERKIKFFSVIRGVFRGGRSEIFLGV